MQGLSLPTLIHRLRVVDGRQRGRGGAARAARPPPRRRSPSSTSCPPRSGRATTRSSACGALYEYRKRRFAARAGKIEDDGYEDRSLAYQQTLQAVLAAQRDALVRLRNDGEISNEVMNRVVQELDLEESRLEI